MMFFIKYFKIVIFIVFAALFFLSAKAEKRALIIAIAKYPEKSGWTFTASDNDALILKSGLIKQGFSEKNIEILSNEQASKIGIVKAFDDLIKKTNLGDIVFFHFSGHGQQVTDINGDEIDGLDEALVPYDAPQRNIKGKKCADKHLLDDELNELIIKLRKKAGKMGDVLACIDACHSGTIYRGDNNDTFRGTDIIFEIPGYANKNIYTNRSQPQKNNENMAPFLIISACAAEQTNKEYYNKEVNKKFGALSYTISTLFSKDMSNMSYTSFFESIKVEMYNLGYYYRTRQIPQAEGNLERKVFAGNAVSIPNHFLIERYSPGDEFVVINGGLLAGIKSGTVFNFYHPDTYNTDTIKPIQTAIATDVGLVESILKLPSTQSNINKNLWAIVSKYTFAKGQEKDARAKILREATSVKKDIKLEIIPVDKNRTRQNIIAKMRSGNIEFYYNDWFDIQVINTGTIPLYFQFINVLADNEIKLLEKQGTKNDYYIKPGEKSKLFGFVIDENSPLGLETIVLVASSKILDLSTIETSKPNLNRNSQSEFEEFLNNLFSDERSPGYLFQEISIDSKSYYVKSK